MRDLQLGVELLADPVADEGPHDAEVGGGGVVLDGPAEVGDRSPRPHGVDAPPQALVGDLDEASGLRRGLADEVGGVRIAVDTLAVDGDVEVDDVAGCQLAAVGDAVADDLVDAGAERLGEAAVAEGRRIGTVVAEELVPGITTDELDRIGHEFLCDHGAYPSTLGYRGFPKSLCSSVNEVICHGIPDSRRVEDGDIVNIDITAFLDGVHGDTNATFLAGDVDEESRLLVERTREALERGIRAVKPGRRINVIGRVIESYAKRFGYGVVREFTGHGIGSAFHSGLVVPHYDDAMYDDVIEVGMTFTIEPMLNLGTHEWEMWDDNWTVVTKDGRRSAQFEHTLLVTPDGAEVLTLP